jgi:NADH dehydrogenase (ubiquinone) 1 alpha subcomplex subunit 13
LLAEADRDTYRREQAQLAREKEIMKDVKGWEVSMLASFVGALHLLYSTQAGKSVYNTKRYTPQSFAVL